jgi:hypothetical protein
MDNWPAQSGTSASFLLSSREPTVRRLVSSKLRRRRLPLQSDSQQQLSVLALVHAQCLLLRSSRPQLL